MPQILHGDEPRGFAESSRMFAMTIIFEYWIALVLFRARGVDVQQCAEGSASRQGGLERLAGDCIGPRDCRSRSPL